MRLVFAVSALAALATPACAFFDCQEEYEKTTNRLSLLNENPQLIITFGLGDSAERLAVAAALLEEGRALCEAGAIEEGLNKMFEAQAAVGFGT